MEEFRSKIRPYTSDDARRVLQLEYTRFDEPLTKSLLNFLLKKYGSDWFYVMDLDGDGQIDAYLFAGKDNDDWIHVLSLVVLEEFEGEGIGQFLMRYLKEKTKKNFNGLRLEVNQNNDHAVRLYIKLGFEQVDFAENYYSKGEHALVMHLKFE